MKTSRSIAVLAVLAVGIAVACRDVASPPSTSVDDLIVSGTIYSAAWVTNENGQLRLAGMGSLRVRNPSGRSGSFSDPIISSDTSRAYDLAVSLSATPGSISRAAYSASADARPRVKGRSTISRLPDGRKVEVVRVPDSDRRSGRPARAMITRVSGKLTSIIEWKYTKAGKSWRVASSRLTLFDSTERVLGITDQDESALRYAQAIGPKNPGALAALSSGVARAIRPDALYAAAASVEDNGCVDALREMTFANAAAAVAVAAWRAAELAETAAFVAMTIAFAAAASELFLNPALNAASAAATAAHRAAVAAANAALGGSIIASAYAGAKTREYYDCITSKPRPPGGDGTGNCTPDEEEYCDYYIYQDGSGQWHIEERNCGCEPVWAM